MQNWLQLTQNTRHQLDVCKIACIVIKDDITPHRHCVTFPYTAKTAFLQHPLTDNRMPFGVFVANLNIFRGTHLGSRRNTDSNTKIHHQSIGAQCVHENFYWDRFGTVLPKTLIFDNFPRWFWCVGRFDKHMSGENAWVKRIRLLSTVICSEIICFKRNFQVRFSCCEVGDAYAANVTAVANVARSPSFSDNTENFVSIFNYTLKNRIKTA